MGGKANRRGADGWGSNSEKKHAAIKALRYGPAPLLPGSAARTRQKLIATLGATGWIALDGAGEGDSARERDWQLGPACGSVLGISAGREELGCALAGADGRLISHEATQLHIEAPKGKRQATPADFEKALAELIQKCVDGGQHAPIVAVAVAWPGRVDPTLSEGHGDPHPRCYIGAWEKEEASLSTCVRSAMKLAGLEGEPPVYAVNDADANLMALAHSTCEDHRDFAGEGKNPGMREIQAEIERSTVILGVTITGGVGGALMMGPEPPFRRTVHRGSHGFVGELGQIPVDVTRPETEKASNISGMTSFKRLKRIDAFPKWNCVHRETLDHYASGRSIVEQLYEKLEGGYNGRIEDINRRLARGEGDAKLQHVMDRCGRLIGQALIGPTLTIDPDLIVISSFAWSADLLTGVEQGLRTSTAHGAGLGERTIVLAPADPARTVKGAARWAIEERIAPVLEQVCGRGSTKEEFEELEAGLHEGAISPNLNT